MIYSVSARHLLLNFNSILDVSFLFMGIFFSYTLNIESNVIIFVNSGLKVSERGEIQPRQVKNFSKLFYICFHSKKKK